MRYRDGSVEGCRWSLTEFRAVDHIPPELGHALMHRCRRRGANAGEPARAHTQTRKSKSERLIASGTGVRRIGQRRVPAPRKDEDARANLRTAAN